MAAAESEALKSNLFEGYDLGGFHDEMIETPGMARPPYADIFEQISHSLRLIPAAISGES